jgi:putative FmdB family regulatory protein
MIVGVVSGKGGTGKTTVAVNLAWCAPEPVLLLDCDVEEPNCHLFFDAKIKRTEPVYQKTKRIQQYQQIGSNSQRKNFDMPTYEYECHECHRNFTIEQRISDLALTECPQCRGPLQRMISGGSELIIKGGGGSSNASGGDSGCSLTRTGSTCCGREQRCDKPSCG